MSTEEFIYPAPSWRTGDAVIVDCDGSLWDGCVGEVTGADDPDDDTWLVQFDGMLTSLYGYALRVPTAEEASGDL